MSESLSVSSIIEIPETDSCACSKHSQGPAAKIRKWTCIEIIMNIWPGKKLGTTEVGAGSGSKSEPTQSWSHQAERGSTICMQGRCPQFTQTLPKHSSAAAICVGFSLTGLLLVNIAT